MNVRDFCSMIEEYQEVDEKPWEITLGFSGDYPDIDYNSNNDMHIAIYGRYKIKNVLATGLNEFHLVIEVLPPTPVIE